MAYQHDSIDSRERVLVIDDDLDSRDLLCALIDDAGFRPVRVYNGREALLLLQKSKPLFVVLDLAMPEMNGWELLKRMRADPALASVPVVVVSARSMQSAGLKRTDVAAFLQKPLDVEKFDLVLSFFRRRVAARQAGSDAAT